MDGFRCSSLFLIACWAFLLSPSPGEARPTGAPMAACVSMMPQHNTTAQASQPVYTLNVQRLTADTLSVSITPTTGAGFKGFLIEARRDGSTTPIGTFEGTLPPSTRFMSCSAQDDSVTHSDNTVKDGVTFTWRSPGGSLTGSRFVATTCLDLLTFWVQYTSVDLGEVMGEKV